MCKLNKLVSEQFSFELDWSSSQFLCNDYRASSQSSFSGAVKNALACIGNNDLVLKQVEVFKEVYKGSDCFIWFPNGPWI